MTRKTAELQVKLIDDVSRPARSVAQALRDAQRNVKDIAAAMQGVGATNRLQTALAKLGATKSDVNSVADAWRRYAANAGLAGDATKWTRAQVADVKRWESTTIAALRSVKREHAAFAKGAPLAALPGASSGLKSPGAAAALAKPSPVASAGMAAALARMGGGAMTGALSGAGGVYMAAQAAQRSADVRRRMLRSGITGDAEDADIAAGTDAMRRLAAGTALKFDAVQKGLDSVVASGRSFGDALRMMPSIAATAQASGAEVEDIANSSTALLDHMNISIKGLQAAQDALAAGGKLGKFELKDAARYLPSMLPAVKALGLQGQEGLEKLSAMLQVIRAGTGTAEEAAASANNIFAKMESEETAKKFLKFGVNLREEMAKARKEGKDLLSVFVELTNKALNGDLSKLPQLFSDMEFARGMRALVTGWEKVAALQAQIRNSSGTVAADLARVTKDSQSLIDRLGEAKDRAQSSAGEAILSLASGTLEATVKELNAIADRLDRFRETKDRKGLGEAIKQAAKEAVYEFAGRDLDAGREGAARWLRERNSIGAVDNETGVIAALEKQAESWQRRIAEYTASGRDTRPLQGEVARLRSEITRRQSARDAAINRVFPRIDAPEPFNPGLSLGAPYPDREGWARYPETTPQRPWGGKAWTPEPPRRPADMREPPAVSVPVAPLDGAAAKSAAQAAKEAYGELATTLDGLDKTITPKVDTAPVEAAKSAFGELDTTIAGLKTNITFTVDGSQIGAALAMAQKLNAELARAGALSAGLKSAGAAPSGLNALARGGNTSFRAPAVQGE